MANTSLAFRPTIFLDTNALHYMSSYLRLAKRKRLPPFEGGKNYEQVRASLRRSMPQSIADMLLRGAETLAFLQHQVNEADAVIYTSRFAKAEVVYGVLEGQAHARMAREGLPYRMRQRVGVLSELVSMYLRGRHYKQVIEEWDRFLTELYTQGSIQIEYAEDNTDFYQIAEMSEFVQSRVFIDVIDSWMYACALVMQAEIVVTFDGYFKRVINRLHDPPEEEKKWKILQKDLLSKLKHLLLEESESTGPLILPLVRKLDKDLPKPW